MSRRLNGPSQRTKMGSGGHRGGCSTFMVVAGKLAGIATENSDRTHDAGSCYDRAANATCPAHGGVNSAAFWPGETMNKNASQGDYDAEPIKTTDSAPRCRRCGRGLDPLRASASR